LIEGELDGVELGTFWFFLLSFFLLFPELNPKN
jgi:hypothetical protein